MWIFFSEFINNIYTTWYDSILCLLKIRNIKNIILIHFSLFVMNPTSVYPLLDLRENFLLHERRNQCFAWLTSPFWCNYTFGVSHEYAVIIIILTMNTFYRKIEMERCGAFGSEPLNYTSLFNLKSRKFAQIGITKVLFGGHRFSFFFLKQLEVPHILCCIVTVKHRWWYFLCSTYVLSF